MVMVTAAERAALVDATQAIAILAGPQGLEVIATDGMDDRRMAILFHHLAQEHHARATQAQPKQEVH